VPSGLSTPLAVQLHGTEPLLQQRSEISRRELGAMEGIGRCEVRARDARGRGHQRPIRPQHPSRLSHECRLVVEVLDRLERADDVERVRVERERGKVALDEFDVRARIVLPSLGDRIGRAIEPNHAPCHLGEMRRPVTNPAGCVEHVGRLAPAPGEVVPLQVEGEDSRRHARRHDPLGIAHFPAKYPLPVVVPALRRLPLERAILIAVPVTVLGIACSSSWSTSLQSIGRPVRAIGLAALLVLALAQVLARPGRLNRAVIAGAAAFAIVAVVSAAWSVEPRHSLETACAFAAVLVVAAALARGADREARRRLLGAVLAGAALVAVAGLLVAVISPHDAVQAATRSVGRRYRGIGVNPNADAMLFAIAVPLSAVLWLETGRSARLAAAASFALFAGSIVAAGSRGAAAAAIVGLLVLAVAYRRAPLPRAVAGGAAIALAITAIFVTAVSGPLTPAQAAHARTTVGNTEPYTPNDAEYILRLADEIGAGSSTSSRSVFDTSGRLQAWRGAVRQGGDRPLLGYGFGTEAGVFVDRYRAFEGGVPENSFIGVFLQLGAFGLALLLALVVSLVAAARRRGGTTAAIGLAVLATGLVLAVVQSYVYAVGNVATLGLWLCAFLPAGGRE
jgi:O-antigen ligase